MKHVKAVWDIYINAPLLFVCVVTLEIIMMLTLEDYKVYIYLYFIIYGIPAIFPLIAVYKVYPTYKRLKQELKIRQ
jgi:hypothetical protein